MLRPDQKVHSAGDSQRIRFDIDNRDEKHDGSVNGVRNFQSASPNSDSLAPPQNPNAGVSGLETLYDRYQRESTKDEEDEMRVLSATNEKASVQLVDQVILAAVKQARQAKLVVDKTNDLSRRPKVYSEALRKMASQAPPMFDGSERPKNVRNWLNKMEKLLELIACPEQERVEVASLYMTEDVSNWWDSARPNVEVIPWMAFRVMMEDRYLPVGARETKEEENGSVAKIGSKRGRDSKRLVEVAKIGNHIVNRSGQPIVCHNCGKPGHVKPACEENLRSCRGCGKTGHMVRFCRGANGGQARSQQASIIALCL